MDVPDPSSQLDEQAGDARVAGGNFTEAIKIYTQCLLAAQYNNPGVLLKRAQVFIKLAQLVSSRPVVVADQDRHSGPDSHTLATLALRDANKLLQNKPDTSDLAPRTYLLRGRALYILEDYAAAQDSFYEGLTFDPVNSDLCCELEKIKELTDAAAPEPLPGVTAAAADPPPGGGAAPSAASPAGAAAASAASAGCTAGSAGAGATEAAAAAGADTKPASSPAKRKRLAVSSVDFECSLCTLLFFEPVTTSCGHTFCRGCLVRSLDFNNRCPMCRTVLHITARKHPVTVSIQDVISCHLGEELAGRKNLDTEHNLQDGDTLPIFALDYVCPGQLMALNIFEPRYRLMVRRCLDGSRKFGMAGLGPAEPVEPGSATTTHIGTEVEILESRQLHDGRYNLQVIARRRFIVLSEWHVDGYRCCRVQFYADGAPLPQPPTSQPQPAAAPGLAAAAAAAAATVARAQHVPAGSSTSGTSLAEQSAPSAEPYRSAGSEEPLAKRPRVAAGAPLAPAAGASASGASADAASCIELAECMGLAQSLTKQWLGRGKALSAHSANLAVLFRQLLARAGQVPSASDTELYSFWICNVLPASTSDKRTFLRQTSTANRLKCCVQILQEALRL